jgi:hypothetical protein
MVVFLRVSASCCWIEPQLKDEPGASGGAAFVWALGALPILASFVLADLGWALVAEIRRPAKQRLQALAAPILLLIGWAAIFTFDYVHHGR